MTSVTACFSDVPFIDGEEFVWLMKTFSLLLPDAGVKTVTLPLLSLMGVVYSDVSNDVSVELEFDINVIAVEFDAISGIVDLF